MKRTLPLALTVAAAVALAGCGSDSSPEAGGDAEYNIAVTKLVAHASLDASIEGFKAAIEDAGLDVKYDDQDANNDQQVVASIAGSVASGDYDLVLGVATPMAQALTQAVSDIPILFTAVTDPLGAGLVDSVAAPGANVTGTSDANPVKEQIELIKEIDPSVSSVGVIYNAGEANSIVQVDWVKEAASALGIEVKEATATNTAEVQQAADSLEVDAIYVPTDNTIVSALDSVLQVGESKGIPVYPAEGDSVANGGVATYGISYYDLGYQTGQMAVRILTEDADPATMPVETQSDLVLYLNTGAAERMGTTLPEAILERAEAENITE
ncbi:putative ABC transport system substrate-binding protein [Micrococcales bacterium KH10]|nr:putative ABC transport system substrate-binding protein [Micrococcales bacterium KH10]